MRFRFLRERLLFLFPLVFTSVVSSAQIQTSDSLALVSLYNATNGSAWLNSENWLSGPVSSWYGVSTDPTRVIDINLSFNGLSGVIPADIGALTALGGLNLAGNQLSGSVPAEIGNLTNLNTLYLYLNQLSGTLPAEIGLLTNVTAISIYGNQFGGAIPSEIGQLSNLVTLSLRNNQFTSVPAEITSLTNVATVRLDNNQLSFLPDLTGITSTSTFNVAFNHLTYEDIEPILSVTGIVYMPQQPFGAPQTYSLNPGDPLNIGFTVGGSSNTYQWMKDGAVIDGANADALSIPSLVSTDHGVYTLRVFNDITGTSMDSSPIYVSLIPANATDSLALVDFYFATNGGGWINNSNWLSGPLMSWHGVTVVNGRVTEINLSSNNLSGTLPPQIGNITELQVLEFAMNMVGGEIPVEIGALSNLHTLYAFNNFFTGEIPTEIGNLTNLTHLAFDSNQLTGAIPTSIGALTNLQWLDLRANQLTGPFPVELTALGNLSGLHLEMNQLSGPIPVEIGNMVALKDLYLNNNAFTGDVPTEFNNINVLEHLELQSNNFTGLPDLTGIDSLQIINVSDNNFDYADLEANAGLPGLTYAPQKNFGAVQYINHTGGPLTLTGTVGGTMNSYQWYKNYDLNNDGVMDGNAVMVNAATADVLNIPTPTTADEGVYQLVVNHSLLNGLTLVSSPITVGLVQDYYWIGDGGTWDDLAHWSLTSGSPNPPSALPDQFDNVHFDANSFTLPGQVVIVEDDTTKIGAAFKTMDWRGVTNTPTFRIRTTVSEWIENHVTGSLYFDDNMIIDFHHCEFYFTSDVNYELDTRGHHLGETCFLAVNLPYGTSPSYPVTASLLSDMNNFNLYMPKGTFASNGFTVTGEVNPANPGGNYIWFLGTAVADLSNSTISAGKLFIEQDASLIDDNATISVSLNLNATNIDFNHVVITDTVPMASTAGNNMFRTLEILPEALFAINPGTTQSVENLIMNGTESTPATLKSRVDGVAVTLSKADGVVDVNFAQLRDVQATGGATFNAHNSWDFGNNSGWNFFYTNVSEADSLALVDFYQATNGDNWFNRDGWLVAPVHQWFGVILYEGRVADINLAANNLIGTIPPSFGTLTGLNGVNLSQNNLFGNIPIEIGNLTQLSYLYLFLNQLSGAIPVEIGLLTNLNQLSIYGNQFSGTIPVEIGQLTNLATLSLRNNQLTGGVPAEIIALPNLNIVRLDNNNLTELGDFTSLTVSSFNVSNNFFTFEDLEPNVSVPGIVLSPQKPYGSAQAFSLKPGDELSLSYPVAGSANSYQWLLNGTPMPGETTSNLLVPSLTLANHGIYQLAASNSITGTTIFSESAFVSLIPVNQSDSLALVALYDSTNGAGWINNQHWLSGPVLSWNGIKVENGRVTQINLMSNNLQGTIPSDIGALTELDTLHLEMNALTGTIPNEIGLLTNLVEFVAWSNQFSGALPAEFWTLNNLKTAYLWSNQFTGGIPAAIGNMTSLVNLALDDNQLVGRIPKEIGQLANLRWLDLHNNQLSGNLPKELGSLTTLTGTNLGQNRFTGEVPGELGNLVNLTQLYLDNNQFTGNIPASFVNLGSLERFFINNNNFTGLPDLVNIDSMQVMDISNNKLTFEDIEPNLDIIVAQDFTYAPQHLFGTKQFFSSTGGLLEFSFAVGGSANHYQWVKNFDLNHDGIMDANATILDGATTDTYSIANMTLSDEGIYQLMVSSDLVPNLTVTSEVVDVGLMQNFYWIGEGGNYKDSTHWSLTSGGTESAGEVPSIHDNVIFDANSFTTPGQTVTVQDDGSWYGVAFRNMDWRGVTNTPTFRIRVDSSDWIANEVTGSMYFDDNMNIDFHAAEFYFQSKENFELDTRGHNLGYNCFLAVNYPYSTESSEVSCNLLSDLNNVLLYVTKGRFNANGHGVTGQATNASPTNYLWFLNSAIGDFSNSVVSAGQLNMADSSVLIDDNATISVSMLLHANNQDFNHLVITDTVVMQFASSNNTFRTLEILEGSSLALTPDSTQIVETLIMTGSAENPLTLKSRIDGVTAYLTKTTGTVDASFAHIKDINATGGATFNAYDSWDDGNNTGWNFINSTDTVENFYWIGNGGDWKDSTHWAIISGGPSIGEVPSAIHNVIFDANSFTTTGQVVSISDDGSEYGVAFKTMDWRGVTNTPTFRVRVDSSQWISNEVMGSLYFDENMIIDFDAAEFYFQSNQDYDLDTKGHHLGLNCYLAVNYDFSVTASEVKCNVLSDLNHVLLYVQKGTFASNGFNVIGQATTQSPANYIWFLNSSVADFSNSQVSAGQLNLGDAVTLIDDNATISVSMLFNSNNHDFNHVVVTDSVIMQGTSTGNIFRTLEILDGAYFALTPNASQTVETLTMNGSEGTGIRLESRLPGTQATITKSTGTVSARFAHIKDVNATGGATFNAYESWDDGNNTGWNFIYKANAADSLALVALYNSTVGTSWTTNTNWLSGNVSTWYGIGMNKNKVASIELSENGLTGTLPDALAALDQLETLVVGENQIGGTIPANYVQLTSLNLMNVANNNLTGTISALPPNVETLFLHENNLSVVNGTLAAIVTADLSGNELTELPVFADTTIQSLNVADNKLMFDDLEPLASIPSFIYSPQDSVGQEGSVIAELGAAVTFTSDVAGNGNVYTWKKDGTVISGASSADLTLSALVLEDDAFYNVEVTNPILPDLTISGYKTELKISSLERDRLALIALYEATNGENWTTNTAWLSANVADWSGVTIDNNRVVGVNLQNNNLDGSVPSDLTVMRSLTSLDLSGNLIDSLANLSEMTGLTTFDVSDNQLSFAALIPNVSIAGISYSPQKPLGNVLDLELPAGSNYSIVVTTPGQGNEYEWRYNGNIVANAGDSVLTISSIGRANMGSYQANVTNNLVPNLTLSTPLHTIMATAQLSGFMTVAGENASAGTVTLYRVNPLGTAYDKLQELTIEDGAFDFGNVVLDDYQLLGFADTTVYVDALPTYYTDKVFWENADVIALNANETNLEIVSQSLPTEPTGTNSIFGTIEEPEEEGGRISETQAGKRVAGAGVSVRRGERSGRPKEGDEIVSYVFSNEEGEFSMPNIPDGSYIFNIQYPGYEMNEESDIYIEFGASPLETHVSIQAVVDEGKINVVKQVVTSVGERQEYRVIAYPNPAKDVLNMNFDAYSAGRTIVLTDISGKSILIQKAENQKSSINVSGLNRGFYILNVQEIGKTVKSLKVSVQ